MVDENKDENEETIRIGNMVIWRPQPLERLKEVKDDEYIGDDFIPIEEDELVKEDPPIPEDKVIGWASSILVDHNEGYSLLDCPSCHATFSSKLSFCPGCGLMVSLSLRTK